MPLSTRQRVSWIVCALIFVGSLFAVAALDRAAAGTSAPGATTMRHGFRLEESAHRRGVDFVHEGPTFDAKLEPIMPEVASMGAAVSVADVDRDGWPDFYVTNSAIGSLNRLYRNNHDGTFTDVAAAAGVADVNRWAPCGATTTTTATKICSSTSTDGRSCSTTKVGRRSRV
jgi:hypothetical protein